MTKYCQICGAQDFFTAVAMEGVCAVCKPKYIGHRPPTSERITAARRKLGLSDGEFLQHRIGHNHNHQSKGTRYDQ